MASGVQDSFAMPALAERPSPIRIVLVVLAIALALSSLGAAHWYLARRFVIDPGVAEPVRSLALGLLVVLGVGAVLQPALERFLKPPWLQITSFPFLIWMGLFWLSFVALAISDGVLGLMGARGGSDAAVLHAAFVGALVLALAALALRNGLRLPNVRRVEIALARWPQALDGFRIVQISDIHIGPLLGRGFAEGLTRRVNALEPDLVAVTGDLVDGSVEALRDAVAPFAELRGRHGVFFVTGNHDVYSGGEKWVDRVKELGLRVLRNERIAIGGADGFDLAGVDDHRGDWVHGSTEDLDAAVAGRDESRALVLLAHDPGTFRRAAARDVDLQLSGHTHGGQIWPFVYLVRLAVPFVAGLYRVGKSQLYVSRGSGFWGPPMRLLAPSEISEIVLRAPRS
jgi:predicted MPP superfamily phosphohydrolase